MKRAFSSGKFKEDVDRAQVEMDRELTSLHAAMSEDQCRKIDRLLERSHTFNVEVNEKLDSVMDSADRIECGECGCLRETAFPCCYRQQ